METNALAPLPPLPPVRVIGPRAVPAGWPADVVPRQIIESAHINDIAHSVFSWPGDIDANGHGLSNVGNVAAVNVVSKSLFINDGTTTLAGIGTSGDLFGVGFSSSGQVTIRGAGLSIQDATGTVVNASIDASGNLTAVNLNGTGTSGVSNGGGGYTAYMNGVDGSVHAGAGGVNTSGTVVVQDNGILVRGGGIHVQDSAATVDLALIDAAGNIGATSFLINGVGVAISTAAQFQGAGGVYTSGAVVVNNNTLYVRGGQIYVQDAAGGTTLAYIDTVGNVVGHAYHVVGVGPVIDATGTFVGAGGVNTTGSMTAANFQTTTGIVRAVMFSIQGTGDGWTGTFTSAGGKTVSVFGGIITNVL